MVVLYETKYHRNNLFRVRLFMIPKEKPLDLCITDLRDPCSPRLNKQLSGEGNKNDLWRHSLVVMVVVSMSRQMGQVSSLCSDFGLTAISASREDSIKYRGPGFLAITVCYAVLGIGDILGADPHPNPSPDPTSFFCDFKDAKNNFVIWYFFLIVTTYPQAHYLQS
jgi:hypothetical protein